MPDKEILPVVQGVRDQLAVYWQMTGYEGFAFEALSGAQDAEPLMQAFARLRERTIEECARVAEQQPMITDTDEWDGYKAAQKDIATAIRSLASPPSVEDDNEG